MATVVQESIVLLHQTLPLLLYQLNYRNKHHRPNVSYYHNNYFLAVSRIDYNELSWIPPESNCCDNTIHWDDGVYSGNSIGTGGAVEFDVAARWTPEQLSPYHDGFIY